LFSDDDEFKVGTLACWIIATKIVAKRTYFLLGLWGQKYLKKFTVLVVKKT